MIYLRLQIRVADAVYRAGDVDVLQRLTPREGLAADVHDRLVDVDALQRDAEGVFVNRIISITCTLNDRKVIA